MKTTQTGQSNSVLLAVLAIFGLLLLGGGGTIYAADSAGPGDPLYSVDKGYENLRRALTTKPSSKMQLELDILEERVGEMDEAEDAMNEAADVGNPDEYEEAAEDFENAIEEVEEQADTVEEEAGEFEDAAEEGDVDDTSKTRIMERIQTQMEIHLELMTRLQAKMEENGNEQAAEALMKAAQNYEDNRQRTMENLQRVGDAKEEKEQAKEEGTTVPPGQAKKTTAGTETESDSDTDKDNPGNAVGHTKNSDGSNGPPLEVD